MLSIEINKFPPRLRNGGRGEGEERGGEARRKIGKDFVAHKTRERWRRVLSVQADRFVGAKRKGKTSACSDRIDGVAAGSAARVRR
jgi:hypothetical protein